MSATGNILIPSGDAEIAVPLTEFSLTDANTDAQRCDFAQSMQDVLGKIAGLNSGTVPAATTSYENTQEFSLS